MSNLNTSQSFKDKWEKNSNAFFEETLREGSVTQRWIIERNGFATLDDYKNYLAKSNRILDAGCGNGRVTALLRSLASERAEIVGIDLVAADVARENFKNIPLTYFYTYDLLEDLSELGKFDYIYCQEVLHHTTDPEASFRNLSRLLETSGELAIYVYKLKAPVREFVDDFIRDKIASMPYEQATDHCRQITEFGRILSESNFKVSVPKVDLLEIPAGEYSVQRLIYHFFAKCYWNSGVSFDENVLVNYDWYHPQTASRHTLPEVEQWFIAAGLTIVYRHEDMYGITVRGVKAQ